MSVLGDVRTRPVAEIVPARKPGRVVTAVLALAALGWLVHAAATGLDWGVVARYFTASAVVDGLVTTLWLTAVTLVLGFLLGVVLATFRLSGNPVLSALGWGYVWLFRSVPLIVQLLFWFNFGAGISPLLAAVIGLTLHEAAYAAEIVRGGILSVDAGQVEAARALGFGRVRVLRRIVLPQAMRAIVPAAGNLLIGTLKGTSIVSVLAVQDLLHSVQLIYARTYEVIPLLVVATVWYVIVTSLLSLAQHHVERYFARGVRS
ncbi:amino acid ABC transporter permease [Lentzea chajnantorensis]